MCSRFFQQRDRRGRVSVMSLGGRARGQVPQHASRLAAEDVDRETNVHLVEVGAVTWKTRACEASAFCTRAPSLCSRLASALGNMVESMLVGARP